MNIKELAAKEKDYIVGMRRYFHQYPELSLKEEKTSQKIQEELKLMGIPYVIVGDYGIVATIEGNSSDTMVALRADIDALPIQEETDVEYKSKNPGVMHACAHDGHIAMLLGAAKILKSIQKDLKGTVKLCFQQAEETGFGAKEILAELKKYPVKSVFGTHLWSEIETGKISLQAGPRMAASEGIEIVVHGVGTHGAYPSRGVDPIITASAIIMNLSAMVSRELNPLRPTVLAFGKIQGGTLGNIIPEKVVINGGMRNTDYETQAYMKEAIPRIAKATAETYRAKAEVNWPGGVPIVMNDAKCSAIAEKAAEKIAGKDALIEFETLMASENYGEFAKVYPSVFAFVGVRNECCDAKYPHHHPKFNIDEEPLSTGSALFVQYCIDFFNKEQGE